jgi:hypothetical protein
MEPERFGRLAPVVGGGRSRGVPQGLLASAEDFRAKHAPLVASVPVTHWVHRAAAQDDDIILTASASEVGSRPGGAYANSAAARAVADHEAGSSTQGAAASPQRRRTAAPGPAQAPATRPALARATKPRPAVAALEASPAPALVILPVLVPAAEAVPVEVAGPVQAQATPMVLVLAINPAVVGNRSRLSAE